MQHRRELRPDGSCSRIRAPTQRHRLSQPAKFTHRTHVKRGGIAVVATIGLGLAAGGVFGVAAWHDVVTLGAGMVALGVVGWLDDRRGVKPSWRMVAHLLTAIWTLMRLGGLPALRVRDSALQLGVIGYTLGILGIVWPACQVSGQGQPNKLRPPVLEAPEQAIGRRNRLRP